MAKWLKVIVNVTHNYANVIKRNVEAALNVRMDTVSENMVGELRSTLSRPGPSKAQQPPGLTQLSHKERVPGGLMQSINWKNTNTTKRIVRRIGTPLQRGYWLEMGVAGGVVIRPRRAKALIVPISADVGMRLSARKTSKKIGTRITTSGGKRRVKRQNKAGKRGYLGVFQDSRGNWWMLRSFIIQGPIAPRPWLKPTFDKNLRRIGLTLSQGIY